MLDRVARRFLYRFEFWVSRSLVLQLLFLTQALLVTAVVAGVMLRSLNPQDFPDTSKAVWWAFLHLTDTGYMGSDNGLLKRMVSIILTFGGCFLFLGGVIATLTTSFDQLLSSVRGGRTRVVEDDHFIVVGRGSRVQTLVEELANSMANDARNRNSAIVVLSDCLPATATNSTVGANKKIRVVHRCGSPLQRESWQRVDALHSQSVIFLSGRERLFCQLSDVAVVRDLAGLDEYLSEVNLVRKPKVVLDLSSPNSLLMANNLGPGLEKRHLASQDFLGKLLCQTIRFPGIAEVFSQLMTDSWGQSIHLVPVSKHPGWRDLTLRELTEGLVNAVALGFVRGTQSHILQLDEPLVQGDEVVVVSSDLSGIHQEASPAVGADDLQPLLTPVSQPPEATRRLLVVGWNRGFLFALAEIAKYSIGHFHFSILCRNRLEAESESRQLLLELNAGQSIVLEFREGTLLAPQDVGVLADGNFGRVLYLANWDVEPFISDAEVALAHSIVSTAARLTSSVLGHIVELRQDSNRRLFPGTIDILVSEEIVCHMLAQMAVKGVWKSLYEELFSPGGPDVVVRSAQELLTAQEITSELSLRDLKRIVLARGGILLGLELGTRLVLCPQDHKPVLAPTTRFIVLEGSAR